VLVSPNNMERSDTNDVNPDGSSMELTESDDDTDESDDDENIQPTAKKARITENVNQKTESESVSTSSKENSDTRSPLEKMFGKTNEVTSLYEACIHVVLSSCQKDSKRYHKLDVPTIVKSDLDRFKENKKVIIEVDVIVNALLDKIPIVKSLVSRFDSTRQLLEEVQLPLPRQHIQELGTDFEHTNQIMKLIEAQVINNCKYYHFNKRLFRWDKTELANVKKNFVETSSGFDQLKVAFERLVNRIESLAKNIQQLEQQTRLQEAASVPLPNAAENI